MNHWPISGTLITLEPDRRVDHLLPGADRAFFSVLSGEVTITGKSVRAGDTAWSDPVPGEAVSVIELATARADAPSVVVAYSGRPIGEPVVMGGPFVMNTRGEITKAFADFRSGKFGEVPKRARLQYL